MRESKYLKKIKTGPLKGGFVMYPKKEKKIALANKKVKISKYDNVDYLTIRFGKYKGRFSKDYEHTVDVSEILYDLNKKKRLKCNRMINFDFNKKNELVAIEIISSQEKKKKCTKAHPHAIHRAKKQLTKK